MSQWATAASEMLCLISKHAIQMQESSFRHLKSLSYNLNHVLNS
jgi:hypothetical protein